MLKFGLVLGASHLIPFNINQDGSWSIDTNHHDLDHLQLGEVLTEIFKFSATDPSGASVANSVTVTITGTADALPTPTNVIDVVHGQSYQATAAADYFIFDLTNGRSSSEPEIPIGTIFGFDPALDHIVFEHLIADANPEASSKFVHLLHNEVLQNIQYGWDVQISAYANPTFVGASYYTRMLGSGIFSNQFTQAYIEGLPDPQVALTNGIIISTAGDFHV